MEKELESIINRCNQKSRYDYKGTVIEFDKVIINNNNWVCEEDIQKILSIPGIDEHFWFKVHILKAIVRYSNVTKKAYEFILSLAPEIEKINKDFRSDVTSLIENNFRYNKLIKIDIIKQYSVEHSTEGVVVWTFMDFENGEDSHMILPIIKLKRISSVYSENIRRFFIRWEDIIYSSSLNQRITILEMKLNSELVPVWRSY